MRFATQRHNPPCSRGNKGQSEQVKGNRKWTGFESGCDCMENPVLINSPTYANNAPLNINMGGDFMPRKGKGPCDKATGADGTGENNTDKEGG